MTTKYYTLIVIALFMDIILNTTLCPAAPDYVTVTLPEQVIKQSIVNTLPLPLNPGKGMLEGSLVLEKIDRFELGKNKASVHGLIIGRNLVLTTRVGDQDLRLKLGEMQLPLRCDFTFRYDPGGKNLYITPHLADSLKEAPPDQASSILPVLALLSDREYPVSFDSLKKFHAMVGQRKLAIEMEPVDVQVVPGELVLKMIPKVSKTN